MKCRWCEENKERLVKAHVIPKAFFNYDGKTDRKIVAKNEYSKRRPKGSYDKGILCEDCETKFQQIDSDATNILINNLKRIPFNDKRDELAFQVDGPCSQKLKQFLIYVLWRASVSTLKEFGQVSLGKHYEEKIKKELIEGKKFGQHEYSFFSFKIERVSGFFYPMKCRIEDRNYYEIGLAKYVFFVKVDSLGTPEPYKCFAEHENVAVIKLKETPKKRRAYMLDIIKSLNAPLF